VDFIDIGLLQELQDSFASLGRLSIQICDAGGELITAPSCAAPGCERREAGTEECGRCARSAVTLSARVAEQGEPLLSSEDGMRHCAAPIQALGHRLGTVVSGNAPEEVIPDDALRSVAGRYGLEFETLCEAVRQGTEDRLASVERLPSVLSRVIETLCEQRFEIRRRLEEVSTVCDVTRMLSGDARLKDAMAGAAARVAEVMRVKAATIRLVDEERGELVLYASHNLSREYVEKGVVTLADNPIDQAAFRGETVYVEDATTDPRVRYPEAARREGFVSGLCVPMSYRGEVVGVLRIYSSRRQRFSGLETTLLRTIGSQIAAAVTHSRLYEQRLSNERYAQQITYAAEIQRRMISALPRHPRISFGAEYDPRLEVGGDFYDFVDLPYGTLGVCIADVVGKGIPAALLMASVRAGLRAHAHDTYHIKDIMEKVNRGLCRDTLISEFVTLFYGVFAPDGSQLTYCNAGHEPPLLLRGEEALGLSSGNMVLGIDPAEAYRSSIVNLESGDVIVMVTDGVTEAMNFDEEPFGRHRLIESVRRYRDRDARTLATQLLWDVRRFVGLADKIDDLTLVVAKVR
jgi:sigma-B regulation protein RsbU (phosphoserine phosphatase)